VLTRSIAPELWTAATPLSVSERKAIVDRVCSEFSTLFDHFRQHSSATMIVHTLELPTIQLTELVTRAARMDNWTAFSRSISF
jgi:hypothetical protein